MLQAFVIVFREGFEAFLIVAITLAYLKKTQQVYLKPAVSWGIAASVITSGILGYCLLKQANQSLWEAIFGLIAAGLVSWLVIHMWRTAPRLKQEMESHLTKTTSHKSHRTALLGVFLFTVFMITREGMETALLLIQIHDLRIVTGILLGVLAAAALSFLWARFGSLINLKLFFQVTALFLLLFVVQILFYSFHEFTEVGLFPNSEALHVATEPFSANGIYGKWITALMIGTCAVWLVGAWIVDHFSRHRKVDQELL